MPPALVVLALPADSELLLVVEPLVLLSVDDDLVPKLSEKSAKVPSPSAAQTSWHCWQVTAAVESTQKENALG